MPELPEVETIRRGLVKRVLNKTIERVEVRCKRIILRPRPVELERALAHQSIKEIGRRGKFLLFETNDYKLLIHLGMTGQLTFWDKTQKDDNDFFVHPLTGMHCTTGISGNLGNGGFTDLMSLNRPKNFGSSVWSLFPLIIPGRNF